MVAVLNNFSTLTDRKHGKTRAERQRIRAEYRANDADDFWGPGDWMFMYCLDQAIRKSPDIENKCKTDRTDNLERKRQPFFAFVIPNCNSKRRFFNIVYHFVADCPLD